ncbi:MAG: transketolase family protein [Nanoarchaeota archaeon]
MISPEAKLAANLYNNVSQKPTRDGFGDGVVEAGKQDKNVVLLCCDLTDSTKSNGFKKTFPERFIEVGIQEQNMAGIAAGMALCGKVPFITSYAAFNPGRNWDQLRVSICYSETNVKMIGAHAGISVGPDGATHQALEDVAITRVLPNLTVIVPCDYFEAKKASIAMAKVKGPFYMRFGRENVPVITTEETPYQIGKAQTFRQGKDVTVIACGSLVYEALIAAKQLESDGIDVRVINMHTIKPLDKETIVKAAKETGAIVTAEEHQIIGGLGGAVAECIVKNYPVPVEFVGVNDRFGESGQQDELMTKFLVKSPNIVWSIKEAIKRKR